MLCRICEGGMEPSIISFCWISVWEDQEQIASAEDAFEALDSGLGEGGRVGAKEEGVEFGNYNFVGETRGAITFVIWDVCVVVGKVKVRWDITCGLSSETEGG